MVVLHRVFCSSPTTCCVCHPPFSKIFSKIPWAIKAKLHVEPPWEGGMKVNINHPGHMAWITSSDHHTHMLKPSKIFFRTRKPMILKLGMEHPGLKVNKVYINDELGRPWPILCLGQNWSHDFAWEKTMDFYEIVAGYDLKIGRCRHLNQDKCSIRSR